MSQKKPFKTHDLITMKQFEGGWIWLKNLEEFIQQFIQVFEKNKKTTDLNQIVKIIKGKIDYNWKIYDDTQWLITIQPFKNNYLLFIYNENEEFGSEIKIFFNKSFLQDVPTEDAYYIVELYLKLLTRLFDSSETNKMLISEDIISIDELLDIVDKENKEKLRYEILEIRAKIINMIPIDIIREIAKKLNGKFYSNNWNDMKIDWCLAFSPFNEVKIYQTLIKNNFQIFYSISVLKFHSARDILFFSWIYCNGIIREARKKMGDKLPKLSKYL